ncbi:site-specific integrase [Parasedimentitalea psychrophila]|uniref:Tyr recombinase domain-containing protein n=1 Tax=Parasedimentitalea psychrophila TaxID=2997337 RepID=A0A9Y2L022_9RHOB|nr:hypothetical protein [Parasedimentitalea psychrophila]WIY25191.1 hypothetical protein QPJ95_22355 [Parasedimentitalea psychrophila]
MLKRASPNSVTRYVNVIRAVVNHTIDERGLSVSNPFHKLQIKGAGNTAGDRLGLKTVSSERRLPISDRLVEALQEHRENKLEEAPIFDRYGRDKGNTAASATMMKRFRKVISDPKKALHSLRHRKKDDLRNTSCPEEISKVILGHSNKEVAARYGAGFKIDVLRDWMDKSNLENGL